MRLAGLFSPSLPRLFCPSTDETAELPMAGYLSCGSRRSQREAATACEPSPYTHQRCHDPPPSSRSAQRPPRSFVASHQHITGVVSAVRAWQVSEQGEVEIKGLVHGGPCHLSCKVPSATRSSPSRQPSCPPANPNPRTRNSKPETRHPRN